LSLQLLRLDAKHQLLKITIHVVAGGQTFLVHLVDVLDKVVHWGFDAKVSGGWVHFLDVHELSSAEQVDVVRERGQVEIPNSDG
jgi:hypothetical protein